MNKDEGDLACAIREVQEEVGFDITQIARADQFLENNIHDHQVSVTSKVNSALQCYFY